MAVTPNYGWPVPVATDLVKDGYAQIADLGDAIDATVFALPAPSSGLTFITSQTLTASSSYTFQNVFSATYTSYLVIWNGTSSPNPGTNLIFDVASGGARSNTGNWAKIQLAFTPSLTATQTENQTDIIAGRMGTQSSMVTMQIGNPFLASETNLLTNAYQKAASNYDMNITNGNHFLDTSYDGFYVAPSSGTMTGTFKIYGYQNS